MLTPGNIIYGYCKSTNPPKLKYLISLYRDEACTVLTTFTTSQLRSGHRFPEHGASKCGEDYISYCFKANKIIGKKPKTNEDFTFSKDTTVTFDYGVQKGEQHLILNEFENPSVVGVLHKEEYYNLVYAMYKSKKIKKNYKTYLEKVLETMPHT